MPHMKFFRVLPAVLLCGFLFFSCRDSNYSLFSDEDIFPQFQLAENTVTEADFTLADNGTNNRIYKINKTDPGILLQNLADTDIYFVRINPTSSKISLSRSIYKRNSGYVNLTDNEVKVTARLKEQDPKSRAENTSGAETRNAESSPSSGKKRPVAVPFVDPIDYSELIEASYGQTAAAGQTVTTGQTEARAAVSAFSSGGRFGSGQNNSDAGTSSSARTFLVSPDLSIVNWEKVSARMVYEGEYCRCWIDTTKLNERSISDNDNRLTTEQVQAYADMFDAIYPLETALLGENYKKQKYSIMIEPQDKVSILFYDIENDHKPDQDNGTVGFFQAKDLWNKTEKTGKVSDYSNEEEMFYVDVHFADKYRTMVYSVLVHEFQHLINFVQKGMISTSDWYNEMMSLATEDLFSAFFIENLDVYGGNSEFDIYEDSPWFRLSDFNSYYYTSGLFNWGDSSRAQLVSYAQSYAFGAWLMRNYGGPSFLHELMKIPAKEIKSSAKSDLDELKLEANIDCAESITKALANCGYTDTMGDAFRKYALNLCQQKASVFTLNSEVNSDTIPAEKIITGNYEYYGGKMTYDFPLQPVDLWDEHFKNTRNTNGPVYYDTYGSLVYSAYRNLELEPFSFAINCFGSVSGDVYLAFQNLAGTSDYEEDYIILVK